MKKYSEQQNQNYRSTDDSKSDESKKSSNNKKSKSNYLDYGFDDEEDLKDYERFLR